jgi:hypothetical protein
MSKFKVEGTRMQKRIQKMTNEQKLCPICDHPHDPTETEHPDTDEEVENEQV